jgi:hypothetical protein
MLAGVHFILIFCLHIIQSISIHILLSCCFAGALRERQGGQAPAGACVSARAAKPPPGPPRTPPPGPELPASQPTNQVLCFRARPPEQRKGKAEGGDQNPHPFDSIPPHTRGGGGTRGGADGGALPRSRTPSPSCNLPSREPARQQQEALQAPTGACPH